MVEKTQRAHARPRLAILLDGRDWWVPRKYAQTQFNCGAVDSHGTAPPDSRSIDTASSAFADLVPYATLLRCPTDVSQRSANASRAGLSSPSQYDLKSMGADYHHMVSITATPSGEFRRCYARYQNGVMDLRMMETVRQKNLQRLCENRFRGNRSDLARKLDVEPSYVNDRIADNPRRPLGEKAARNIEAKVGLLLGQLDIPDSPLRMDDSRIDKVEEDLHGHIDGMSEDEKRDMLEYASKLLAKRKKRRRT